MAPTTVFGLAMLGASMALAAAGAGAFRHAAALPAPPEPVAREVMGRVVEVLAQTCGYSSRTYTCYRPVVAYRDGGLERQTVARTATSPAPPVRKGDPAAVLVFAGGTTWIAAEWRSRRAELQRDHTLARRTPTLLGRVLVGCAGFAGLLGLGLIFWVDKGGGPA
jgi:hypothetical protein